MHGLCRASCLTRHVWSHHSRCCLLLFRRFIETHYETLGVKPDASQVEIRNAFVVLSKKYHPDVSHYPDAQKFVKVAEAYKVLGNPQSRNQYDRTLNISTPFMSRSEAKSWTPRHGDPWTQMDADSWIQRERQSWAQKDRDEWVLQYTYDPDTKTYRWIRNYDPRHRPVDRMPPNRHHSVNVGMSLVLILIPMGIGFLMFANVLRQYKINIKRLPQDHVKNQNLKYMKVKDGRND